jgi:probable HAF family extracellular repeat protein
MEHRLTGTGLWRTLSRGFFYFRRNSYRDLHGQRRHAMKKTISLLAFIIILAVFASSPYTATFKSLGEIGHPWDISGNGLVLVGEDRSSEKPFKWTQSGGGVSLGLPDGYSDGLAEASSYDGSVIVGTLFTGELPDRNEEAFRWTQKEGYQKLGFLKGHTNSDATEVSGDGSVVVGYSYTDLSNRQAFRWTAAEGMVGLGFLPGHTKSGAYAISKDGSLIVGGCWTTNGPTSAFRWTAAEGMTELGLPPKYLPRKISADGSTIIGNRNDGESNEAGFVWNAKKGVIDLKFDALGVSGDGSKVVGVTAFPPYNSWIWDSAKGERFLADVFKKNYHLNSIDNWDLISHGMSEDGKVLFGTYGNSMDTVWMVNLIQSVDISGDWIVDVVESFSAKGLGKATEAANSVISFNFNDSSNGTVDLSNGTYSGNFSLDGKGKKVIWNLDEISLQDLENNLREWFISLEKKSGEISSSSDVTIFQLTRLSIKPITISMKTQSPVKATLRAKGNATFNNIKGKWVDKNFTYRLTATFVGKSP